MTVVKKTEYQRPVDRGWAWVVMCGTGCALTLGPGLVVLSSYFDKRRGFANSFSSIGASIGSLVFPKIIQVLIDVYGLQGALIFVSGILFHNLIVAMLLRPLPPLIETAGSIEGNIEKEELLKYTNKEAELSQSVHSKSAKEKKHSNGDIKDLGFGPNQNISSSIEEKSSQILNDKEDEKLKQLEETFGISYNEKNLNMTKELCRSSLDLYTSTGSISCSIHNLSKNEKVGVSRCSQSKATCCTKTSLTSLIDFKLLKNHKLQLVLFVAYFCIFSCGLTITYIPPFARENNTSDEEIAIIVMLFGACDVVARFSVAWISDSKKIKRTNILGITLLITGTVTMFNSFFTNFTSFAMFCVVNGLFGSIYFPFVPLLLVDSVGADNLPSALSLLILVHGISISIMAPLMGYIRDSTGSYNVTFYVIGCGMIIGALALFCDSWVMKLEEQRLQKNREVNSEVEEQKNDIGHEEVVVVNGESTN
ncbi:unnamed protein product [Mytilus edulis]|uniref:Major facilitator superfamily (MFS) profile domain-containing protein n=1 Tax=Mytilus edulis TaxID=6550 RepID=A0A8S3PQV2_MYTED|nr:unnamed protein product [Mytilus edulis]